MLTVQQKHWCSGVLVTYICGTFDLLVFKVILGLYSAIARGHFWALQWKCPT